MLLFLKIVAAVVLVLLVGGVVAWWGFKRWLRRRVGHYTASAALLDDRYAVPARVHLQLSEIESPSASFTQLWDEAHALGFRRRADFETREGNPERLRFAAHESLPIALTIAEHDESTHFALFALAEDQRLRVISDGPGAAMQCGTLEWEVQPSLALAAAFARVQQECIGRSLQAIDLRLFRDVYERAHARRQDAVLRQPPQRDEIARRASATSTDEHINQAHRMARSQWSERVQEAVLDHFRQTSRIDAASWERLDGDLHVVHGQLDAEEIRDLLVGEDSDRIVWQQLQAQGLRGVGLYEAVSERLAPSRQRRCLGEVRQPLLARVYARSEDEATTAQARPHHYSAVNLDGDAVHGVMLARHSLDAKQQIQQLGLQSGKVLTEPKPLGEQPNWMLDPAFAAIAARSVREGLAMACLRALVGNLWLWGPPLALAAWNVYQGMPFGWGDYLGFIYLVIALAFLLLFIAPMLLYNQLLHSRVQARWGAARLCLGLLARVNLLGGLREDQLLLERAKITAGEGELDVAIGLWNSQASRLTEAQFQAGLVQIFDAGGDSAAMIAAQRSALSAGGGDMEKIDLAMSLAKSGEAEEAATLVGDINPSGLSELAIAGYQYARGLVAMRREQYSQALRHFSQAIQQADQFRSMPLIIGLLTEINGYSALSLKRNGDTRKATELWRQVRPLLGKHASCRRLVAEFESA
ncbi:MAG: hypothetical protein ACT4NL_01620 [Pseudomarimonas sp.]